MIHNISLRYKFFGDFYIGDDFLQAGETTLNKLLNTSRQFIVPIFQRNYSWQKSQYEQLWFDILRASKFKEKQNHFIGSIVYIDMGTPAGRPQQLLLIDGQQRLTTRKQFVRKRLANPPYHNPTVRECGQERYRTKYLIPIVPHY